MDQRCCAYSFLKETSRQCDYEVASDELASLIAQAVHSVKHQPELLKLCELVYHANGSIRGRLAIRDEDFEWLDQLYVRLTQENGSLRQFVLPAGCEGACALHVLRSRCKAVLRIAYAIDREEKPVPAILLDFWNLLSNVFFQMALKENRLEGVSEIPFASRSYDVG